MACDEEQNGSAVVTAGAVHTAKECAICKSVVTKPYKILLGGDVICSPGCYQKHLGDPDDTEVKSDLYW